MYVYFIKFQKLIDSYRILFSQIKEPLTVNKMGVRTGSSNMSRNVNKKYIQNT